MSTFAQTSAPSGLATRQEWLAILARTPRARMKEALDTALDGVSPPEFDWLRAPDIGLAMVRGRVGGTGDAFNLGEVTVTRATLRLRVREGRAAVGLAVHMGRDKERATLAALADALLQTPAFEARMHEHLLAPLAARITESRAQKQARAAATKVEFFTMVRGD
ncbi:phosphonate C-P lyase system protein PhnG [Caballeronia mineralivorans]|jgi:alpha-D-ribose 1-methylphosphonate 5-triphosphate synthase subunit PhnG|uniref:phosphonate C-P lyase system protein PhnG n=1 Tax=Caballeronia mineralivorans TaxID=2010198 RepID=UPI0023F04333|nr:phosphonate C-P lyase system protein PhnG [Caballeronia mineralivorans]MDB5789719.1 phosphonate lyase system protein PhnG [Caballeronia mineralivorans]MEA3095929.1 alpha-D-ribose 1-methylphosphonate 5-triphosphate synthase subunit PhnG [Caballeronia mineralivorans]